MLCKLRFLAMCPNNLQPTLCADSIQRVAENALHFGNTHFDSIHSDTRNVNVCDFFVISGTFIATVDWKLSRELREPIKRVRSKEFREFSSRALSMWQHHERRMSSIDEQKMAREFTVPSDSASGAASAAMMTAGEAGAANSMSSIRYRMESMLRCIDLCAIFIMRLSTCVFKAITFPEGHVVVRGQKMAREFTVLSVSASASPGKLGWRTL